MTTTARAKYLAAARDAAPKPRRVITLDMDGTTFDPWGCCGRRDDSYLGTEACPHHRHDTIAAVKAAAEKLNAEVVVLSWRMGPRAHEATQRWIAGTGLAPTAFFMPGSADDITTAEMTATARREFPGHGQVAFKVATVRALQAQGVQVLAGWEDANAVVEALTGLGVVMTLVPRLVQVSSADYAAGRVGGATKKAHRKGTRDVDPRLGLGEVRVPNTPQGLFESVHGVDKFWEV